VGGIVVLSMHNLFCWKFPAVSEVGRKFAVAVEKITTFCPLYFFNLRHYWL